MSITYLLVLFLFVSSSLCSYGPEFLDAIRDGQLNIVKNNLEKNSNINNLIQGYLPLNLAAHYGRFDIVKHFIAIGANPNGLDSGGIFYFFSSVHLN